MVDFRAVTRDHVLGALEEYDAAGGEALLALVDRSDGLDHVLRFEGRRYDAKVVAGLAYLRATTAAAAPEQLFRGRYHAGEVLPTLGFDLTVPAPPPPPAREPRPTRSRPPATRPRAQAGGAPPAPTRRVAETDRPFTLCPTCRLALPATGICDDCD